MERNSNCLDCLDQFKRELTGRVLILGIGNTLRSDDGLGSLLARRISGHTAYIVYDAGLSPENYLGKIIQEAPDTVLLVDAVDFAANPGDFKLFASDELQKLNFFCTHNSSLILLVEYLNKNIKSRILILAVQPKSLSFGEDLSPEIDKTLQTLTGWFLNGKD